MGQRAAVIFTSDNTRWFGRFLHKEVNHCLICVMDRGKWVVIDRTSDGLDVYVLDSLPEGVYCQEVIINNPTTFKCSPFCVGMVKCLIGVSNPLIITPWQLLKYLRKRNGQKP